MTTLDERPPTFPPPPALHPNPELPAGAAGSGHRTPARRPVFGAGATITLGILVTIAGLAVWLVAFAAGLSRLSEAHAQHDLYSRLRGELAAGTAPLGQSTAGGSPVALITAKAAGIDGLVVVQGTTSTDLRDGPGLYPGAGFPGQAGASLLMGRSVSYGAPFAHLTSLRAGDTIDVTTGQGVFHYRVLDVRRPGDPIPPVTVANGSRIVLATSASATGRFSFFAGTTVFVDAQLRGTPAATGGSANTVTSADALMHADPSGLYPLVLWLQVLLVGGVGGIWLRRRIGVWPSWLLSTPVVLAGLWGATSEFWRLLPNLL